MPISIGVPAPAFTLKDQNNQEVRLADFHGRKAVLLVFYPLAFSRHCHGELTEIQANLPTYANETVQVLTVSVDSVYSHKVWAEQESFDFPLLADFWPHGEVAQAYQVFNQATGFANRGTFLIDRDGRIGYAEENGPGKPRDQQAWQSALATLTR
jgi:peroxiredoxin